MIYFLPQDDLIDNTLAAFETGGRTLSQLDRSKPYIGPQTEAGARQSRLLLRPWQQRWDLSLIKKTRIGEGRSVEFRTQFLNAFNNINFLIGAAGNDVNTQTINSEFGQIVDAYRDITVSGTNDPGGRVIEFMLRVVFYLCSRCLHSLQNCAGKSALRSNSAQRPRSLHSATRQ